MLMNFVSLPDQESGLPSEVGQGWIWETRREAAHRGERKERWWAVGWTGREPPKPLELGRERAVRSQIPKGKSWFAPALFPLFATEYIFLTKEITENLCRGWLFFGGQGKSQLLEMGYQSLTQVRAGDTWEMYLVLIGTRKQWVGNYILYWFKNKDAFSAWIR